MKEAILRAASAVLVRQGLNNWTVEVVAREAGCAKGLINYHYRSKLDLLRQAAEALRDDRWRTRLAAVSDQSARGRAEAGADSLDRLWSVLLEEVRSGRFAAWLSLLAASGPLRAAASNPPAESVTLAAAVSQSVGLGERLTRHAGLIEAGLDGLQLRLLAGAQPHQIEEAYHRFWLTVIEM